MAFFRSNVKVTVWALTRQNLPDWFCLALGASARTDEPHYSNASACPTGIFVYDRSCSLEGHCNWLFRVCGGEYVIRFFKEDECAK